MKVWSGLGATRKHLKHVTEKLCRSGKDKNPAMTSRHRSGNSGRHHVSHRMQRSTTTTIRTNLGKKGQWA